MMGTQQKTDLGEQLQKAVLDAAMPADGEEFNVDQWRSEALARKQGESVNANSSQSEKRTGNEKKQAVSPRSGAPTPPGRPKGVRNKLTNLRDAVIEAFERVGGADYLVRLAEGTQSDRAAFVSLMNKVLPTQINQNVEGGVKLELSWLSGRSIGATTAQQIEKKSQVLDLERDSEGQYRIKHPNGTDGGVTDAADTTKPEGAGDAQGG